MSFASSAEVAAVADRLVEIDRPLDVTQQHLLVLGGGILSAHGLKWRIFAGQQNLQPWKRFERAVDLIDPSGHRGAPMSHEFGIDFGKYNPPWQRVAQIFSGLHEGVQPEIEGAITSRSSATLSIEFFPPAEEPLVTRVSDIGMILLTDNVLAEEGYVGFDYNGSKYEHWQLAAIERELLG